MLNNFIDHIKLPFRKDKELYVSIREITGILPHNISYYEQALMHKSVMKRGKNGKPVNNERLEFLGDAILDAVVGDIVFNHFPRKREGFLTNTRSKIVQRGTLNKLASEMGISRLILSSGNSSSHNSYLGGNAFEALVGALYLDKGYDACMDFMRNKVLTGMIDIDKVAYKEVNFKSKLIEWGQKHKVKVSFHLIGNSTDETGSPVFKYMAKVQGVETGEGTGYSKKESQQMAAKLSYNRIRREPQLINRILEAKPDESMADPQMKSKFSTEAVCSNAPAEQTRKDSVSDAKEDGKADEFDLSDINVKPKSREDIIEAAEAAAFRALQDEQKIS